MFSCVRMCGFDLGIEFRMKIVGVTVCQSKVYGSPSESDPHHVNSLRGHQILRHRVVFTQRHDWLGFSNISRR